MVDTRSTANAAENPTSMMEDGSATMGGQPLYVGCSSQHDADYVGPFAPHLVIQGGFDLLQFFDRFEANMLAHNRPPEQWLARLRVQAADLDALLMVDAAIAEVVGKDLTPRQKYDRERDSFFSQYEHLYGPRAFLLVLVEAVVPRTGSDTRLYNYALAEQTLSNWCHAYEAARQRIIQRDGETHYPPYGTPEFTNLFIHMCMTPAPIRRSVNITLPLPIVADDRLKNAAQRFLLHAQLLDPRWRGAEVPHGLPPHIAFPVLEPGGAPSFERYFKDMEELSNKLPLPLDLYGVVGAADPSAPATAAAAVGSGGPASALPLVAVPQEMRKKLKSSPGKGGRRRAARAPMQASLTHAPKRNAPATASPPPASGIGKKRRALPDLASSATRPCISCGQRGHYDRDCPVRAALATMLPHCNQMCPKCFAGEHKWAHCPQERGTYWDCASWPAGLREKLP